MSKLSDIAKVLADKYNLTNKEAVEFLDEFNNLISSALKTDRIVKIKGLGTFRVMKVNSRESVDVNTGERIVIEGRDKISFTPDATMRDLVNSPFAQFSTVVLNDGVDFSAIDKKYDNNVADVDGLADESKTVDEPAGDTDDDIIDATCGIADAPSPDDEKTEGVTEKVIQNDLATITDGHENADEQSSPAADCEHAPDELTEDDAASDDVAVVDIPSVNDSSAIIDDEAAQSVEDGNAVDNGVADVEIVSTADDEEKQPLEFVPENNTDDSTLDSDIAPSDESEKEMPEGNNAGRCEEDDTAEVVAQDASDNNSNDVDEEEADSHHDKQMKVVIALLSVFVLLCLAGVFYFYNQLQIRDHRIQHLEAQMKGLMPAEKDTSAVDSQRVTTTLTPDSITNIQKKEMKKADDGQKEQQKNTSSPEPKVVKEPQVTPVKTIPVKQPSPTPASLEYDKDARVRTGAYEIIGVDQTVTVKNGQTLKSLSRFYLGEGMECYVEVLNGVKEVKTGDKIKIPKLKLKKRK